MKMTNYFLKENFLTETKEEKELNIIKKIKYLKVNIIKE